MNRALLFLHGGSFEIILTPNFTNTKIIIYSALFLVIGFLRIISLWKAFVPKKANCTHFANKFALNLKGIYTSGHCQNRLFKILKLMIKWVVIFLCDSFILNILYKIWCNSLITLPIRSLIRSCIQPTGFPRLSVSIQVNPTSCRSRLVSPDTWSYIVGYFNIIYVQQISHNSKKYKKTIYLLTWKVTIIK